MSPESSPEETRWVRSPRVASVEEDSEEASKAVLVNVDHRAPVVVEGTALEIWRLTAESRTIGDIVSILVGRYGEEHSAVIGDQVRDFLRHLADAGLIQMEPA